MSNFKRVLEILKETKLDTPADKRFEEGYAAGKKHKSPDTCPYKKNSSEYKDWMDGYKKAEDDSGIHSAFRKS